MTAPPSAAGRLALVDRDGLSGAPRFRKAARARGIRPIVGAELTLASDIEPTPAEVVRPRALPLLVETQRGYRNLCRLITRMKQLEIEAQQGDLKNLDALLAQTKSK